MPLIKYSDELVAKAIQICKDNGLVEKWQPVLFAGIHLYEQGDWEDAFPFLEAATLRGNLIAYEYLQAMTATCSNLLAQSKTKNSAIYQRYESLEYFEPTCTIGKDWVKASNYYSAILKGSQSLSSKANAKKLKNSEQALLALCGNLAKNQRANELYWKLHPSKLDFKLGIYLLKSCSVLYRNYLVKQEGRVAPEQRTVYLKQLLTLFKAIDFAKDNDGLQAMQCAINLPRSSVEKKTWHIIAAQLGDPHAAAMLSLPEKSEEKIPYYPFWIYRAASLGEYQMMGLLVDKLSHSRLNYRTIESELEFWCRELIQAATAPLDRRFSVSLILVNHILDTKPFLSRDDLGQLREQLEQWHASLDALSEHPNLVDYHRFLCKIYTLLDKVQPAAQWIQGALHHASLGQLRVENESLFVLYEAWSRKRPDIAFDEVLIEQISQQLKKDQYAPFMCVKEVRSLEAYLDSALQLEKHPVDFQHIKSVLDTLSQYHQQEVNPKVAAWGIMETFSNLLLDMRQFHPEPMQFMRPYLDPLEPHIQHVPALQAMMHFIEIRYGDASKNKEHLAFLERLHEQNCQQALPLIGYILEHGVAGTLAPKPQRATNFYLSCLEKKLSSEHRLFCLNELGKLYLNYQQVNLKKDQVIAYLKECNHHEVAAFAYNLGLVYVADRDTLLQSLPWLEKAARMGDVVAMHDLGCLYANYTAECYEPSLAFEWLLRSLAAGYKASAYSIGVMMFNDAHLRCPETSNLKDWHFLNFLIMAAEDYVHAQYFLAIFYLCLDSSNTAVGKSVLLYEQGVFYLQQAKKNGLLLEAEQVENMLETTSMHRLPASLFDDLIHHAFKSAWQKLGVIELETGRRAVGEHTDNVPPLERSQQNTLLLPRRLQKSVDEFLAKRKLTGNDFIELLKKFCHAGKASLNESAAGSRVTLTAGQRRHTFHQPHKGSETVGQGRQRDYKATIEWLANYGSEEDLLPIGADRSRDGPL